MNVFVHRVLASAARSHLSSACSSGQMYALDSLLTCVLQFFFSPHFPPLPSPPPLPDLLFFSLPFLSHYCFGHGRHDEYDLRVDGEPGEV